MSKEAPRFLQEARRLLEVPKDTPYRDVVVAPIQLFLDYQNRLMKVVVVNGEYVKICME